MVADPKGRLVVGPSVSPENSYRLPNGNVGQLCMGATMDTEIVRGLFGECIRASEILGVDEDFRRQLADARKRMPPIQIGRDGSIMEWAEDYKEVALGHRQ